MRGVDTFRWRRLDRSVSVDPIAIDLSSVLAKQVSAEHSECRRCERGAPLAHPRIWSALSPKYAT